MSITKATFSLISGAPANVLDFGADPTGVNDSTSAINAAIAASQIVYFPQGQYKIGSSINWTNQWLIGAVDNGELSTSANQTMILPTGDFPAFVYYNPDGYNSQGGGIKNFNIKYSGVAPVTPDNRAGIRVPKSGSSGYPAFHTFENITVQGATWAIYDYSGSWMGRWAHINSQNNYAGFFKREGTTHTFENCYHRGGYSGFNIVSVLGATLNNCAVDLCSNAVGGYVPVYISDSSVVINGGDFEGNLLSKDYGALFNINGPDCTVTFNASRVFATEVTAPTNECYVLLADQDAKVTLNNVDINPTSYTGSTGTFYFASAANNAVLSINNCYFANLTGTGTPFATYSAGASTGKITYSNVVSAYSYFGLSLEVLQCLKGSVTNNFGTVNAAASANVSVTVSGATLGNTVFVGATTALPAGIILQGAVTSTNTVQVTAFNVSGAPISVGSLTINVKVA